VIFRILGPLEAEADGQPFRLGGEKQRALLAMLLLNANEVVSRERLIEGLWGDRPPETAQTALQVHVSQLRKVLEPARGRGEPEVLLTRAPGYLIRLEPEALDLLRFERLLREGRSAFAAGDTQTAAETLAEALALWRGQPLAELDSAPFARLESIRLDELRLGAIEDRIEAELALGRHAGVVAELEALVAKHPLRERLRGLLMLALYRCGRQAAALETYQAGRRRLSEELGLEPGEALQRLERAILNHDASLDLAPPSPVSAEPSVPTGTVTFVFTDIEGSTSLVKQLRDHYGELLERHHSLLRGAFGAGGGHEIDSQGDAFFFTFRRARDAVAAAVEAQRAFAAEQWPHAADVKIRIGIHTGEPGLAGAGYHGLDVVRAARISGAAYGGQILVSSATRDLVGDALPEVSFRDLGEHGLREIDNPERIFQVDAPGLREEFPPPRTANGARVMSIGGREEELAAAAQAAVGDEVRRARLSRRTRVLAVLGALLLGGAVVAAVVELTGGGAGRAVLVAPNSVAIVDAKTNRLVADVTVGSRPVAVAFGEGGTWVANADDGTLSHIDPQTRKVVKTIGIGGDVSDVAVGFGSVWVANGNDGTLTRIDPNLDAVETTIDLGGRNALAPQPVFSVATGEGAVWATSGTRVVEIDPATNEVTRRIRLGSVLSLTVGEGAIWVTTISERILRIEPATGAVTVEIPVPSQAFEPVAGGGALWAIVPIGNGEIWRFDPNTGSPSGTTHPGKYPVDLALAPKALWVANEGDETVSRIDPATRKVGATIEVGQQPTGIAVGDGFVWVSVQTPRAT
jgi:YVTN family beta-propeller protein